MHLYSSRHLVLAIVFSVLTSVISQNANAVCNSVTGLNTTNITSSGAKLNWNAVSCDSFLVRYYDAAYPTSYFYKTVSPGTATSFTLTNLYPNTNYKWQVKTYCSGGQSGSYQSSASSFTTLNSTAYCITPNLTSTTSVTLNSALTNWNPLVTADAFQIRYNVTGTTNYVWLTVAGTSSSATLSGLTSATSYTWAVKGMCSGGTSTSYSSSNSFTSGIKISPQPAAAMRFKGACGK